MPVTVDEMRQVRRLVLTAVREGVESAAFSADGRRVVVLGTDGLVRVWSIDWRDLVQGVRSAAS